MRGKGLATTLRFFASKMRRFFAAAMHLSGGVVATGFLRIPSLSRLGVECGVTGVAGMWVVARGGVPMEKTWKKRLPVGRKGYGAWTCE